MSSKPRYTEEQLQQRQGELMALGELLRGPSLAEVLSLSDVAALDLPGVDARHAAHDWYVWGRPKQLVVADPQLPSWWPAERFKWRVAIALGGRAMGKTHMGASTCWHRIERHGAKSLCFVGPTWRDVRRTMVGGKPDTEAGFLDVIPPHVRCSTQWNKNDAEIHVRSHGATIYLNSAEDEEQRGGNFDFIWADEPIKWRRLKMILMNLLLALRKRGSQTQLLLTTTPKRQQWLMDLVMDRKTLVVHGTSYENASNLDPDYLPDMEERIGGTSMGDQELRAMILGDNEAALCSQIQIDRLRVEDQPKLVDVGVGIDPAVSAKRRSDDTGIVAAGRGVDGHLYALEEMAEQYGPDEWAMAAVLLAKEWGAKFVIVERNKIGDAGWALLRHAIRAAKMEGKLEIREAYSIKDKWTRAVPVAALYSERQKRAHHVGYLPTLETILTQWDPTTGASPNVLDAYVHVAIELLDLADVTEPEELDAFEGWAKVNKRLRSGVGGLGARSRRRRGRGL